MSPSSQIRVRPLIGLVFLFTLAVSSAKAQDPNYTFRADSADDSVSSSTTVSFYLDHPTGVALSGWSYAICHDPSTVTVTDVADGVATLGLLGGQGPDFNQISLYDEGWTVGLVVSFLGMGSLAPGSGYELNRATYQLDSVGSTVLDYCNQTLGSPPVDIVVTTVGFQTIAPTTQDGMITVGAVPNFTVRLVDSTAAPGENATVAIELVNLLPLDGFSFGISHDDTLVSLAAIEPGAALLALHSGAGPDFFETHLTPDGGAGGTVGALFSRMAPFEQLPPTDAANPHELVVLTYAVSALAPDEEVTELAFTSDLGAPPVAAIGCLNGESRFPTFQPGQITVSGTPVTPAGAFIRGDINQDGATDISDGIFLFSYLFAGGPTPLCEDAADTNDDGMIAIADGVYIINHLTSGGPAPLPPVTTCAVDPTDDAIPCAQFGACP